MLILGLILGFIIGSLLLALFFNNRVFDLEQKLNEETKLANKRLSRICDFKQILIYADDVSEPYSVTIQKLRSAAYLEPLHSNNQHFKTSN